MYIGIHFPQNIGNFKLFSSITSYNMGPNFNLNYLNSIFLDIELLKRPRRDVVTLVPYGGPLVPYMSQISVDIFLCSIFVEFIEWFDIWFMGCNFV